MSSSKQRGAAPRTPENGGRGGHRPPPPSSDLSVRTWRAMLEVHAALIGELDEQFRARHGLSVSEFDVLINIGARERVRHGELSSRVVLTRTALTRLVDRLVRRGWLVRLPDPLDQRATLIALTDEGRRVRAASGRTNRDIVRRTFAVLDPGQTAILNHLVTCLRDESSHPSDEGTPHD